MLFATSQEVLAAWKVVQPVLDAWGQLGGEGMQSYQMGAGSGELVAPLW